MNSLRLLKAMEAVERAKALEAILNGRGRLVLASLGHKFYTGPISIWQLVKDNGGDYRSDEMWDHFQQSFDGNCEYLEFRDPIDIAKAVLFHRLPSWPVMLKSPGDGEDKVLLSFDFDDMFFATERVTTGELDGLIAIVEEGKSLQKLDRKTVGQTRSDPIRTLMMRYLDQTEGRGDLHGCIEFLLADPGIDEGVDGQIIWTSYSGKPQSNKRKTIQNRFRTCQDKWKARH